MLHPLPFWCINNLFLPPLTTTDLGSPDIRLHPQIRTKTRVSNQGIELYACVCACERGGGIVVSGGHGVFYKDRSRNQRGDEESYDGWAGEKWKRKRGWFMESLEDNGSSTMRFRLLINLIVLMGRKLSSLAVSLCLKKGQLDGVDEKWE
ncbi:hypothetical protein Acr_16g0001370 [Actinidia rufa]|uniref:Uncharacterized protein n=1 Tax=Actinidia rufa TaxID=165716 RepID=A0A7J0FXV8_9ERIC|nr:hypothetical protein Acr_16g0001370 [Actinidia rufa]